MSTGTESPNQRTQTEYEQIIEQMAQLKARIDDLNAEVSQADVPFDIKATVAFLGGDIASLIERIVAYEEGGELPDTCPVCGGEIVRIDELEPGESYDVDRFCVAEKTAGGPGHGILHWSNGGDN